MSVTKDIAYGCWENMIQRCTNPKASKYKYYGGRGIGIHPSVRSFKGFIEHIGPRPSLKHSIDRIDVNKDYEPGNLRWATYSEQQHNKQINTEGCVWYSETDKRWTAELSFQKKLHSLTSSSKEEATQNLQYLRKLKNTPEWFDRIKQVKNKYKNTSSSYHGVNRKRDKWRVTISIGKGSVEVGYFSQEIDAAVFYDTIAKEWLGTRAKLNFP